MSLKRDPTMALQVGFLTLLLICTTQVAWWIGYETWYAETVRNRLEQLYDAEARVVTELFAGTTAPLSGTAIDANTLSTVQALLPHLDIDSGTGNAAVNPEAVETIDGDASSRINRFAWEGGFFLAVLIGGMAVLTRAIRHDAELRKRQQNFLAAVSHEFKSPLASMRLATETLLRRADDPDTRRLGQRLLDDGERLLTMVDNMLDTARLEEGRLQLHREPLPLRPVAKACVEALAERARVSGIDMALDVAEDVTVDADRTTLETVLRNLLDNAVKACVAGGGHAVSLRAARAGQRVKIQVADDGLGFPPQDAAMIFEKFYRLGDELRRTTPGTGLGLYIVRRLVDLSGAEIVAESPGPGQGATVTVSWPMARES